MRSHLELAVVGVDEELVLLTWRFGHEFVLGRAGVDLLTSYVIVDVGALASYLLVGLDEVATAETNVSGVAWASYAKVVVLVSGGLANHANCLVVAKASFVGRECHLLFRSLN